MDRDLNREVALRLSVVVISFGGEGECSTQEVTSGPGLVNSSQVPERSGTCLRRMQRAQGGLMCSLQGMQGSTKAGFSFGVPYESVTWNARGKGVCGHLEQVLEIAGDRSGLEKKT